MDDKKFAGILSYSLLNRLKEKPKDDIAVSDNYNGFWVSVNESRNPQHRWAMTIEKYNNARNTQPKTQLYLHLIHLHTRGSVVTDLPERMSENLVTSDIHELLKEFRKNETTIKKTINVTVNGYSM